MKTYQTWSVAIPMELIQATSSFDARKAFAAKHQLKVHDCMARVRTEERPVSFEQAKARYVHRYTMEHVPAWSQKRPCDDGGTETRYHAPHFRTDREWYDNTTFKGEPGHLGVGGDCYTSGQTWPLGQWLPEPFKR